LNGTVFVVNLPLAVWGLGAKVASSFIKLRFFNVMQQREFQVDWDQKRLVFFMCDEFQEIVSANKDGLSDLNFWDKSRSSKTIGIISAQSVSSFYAAIGDRDCANALLQNFRQKICFRTEDQETLDFLNRLTGRVEVEKISYSEQSGSSGQLNTANNMHRSRGKTVSHVDKEVLNPQLIRNLGKDQAVALLVIDGESRDDVLDMEAVYM
ncbi:MAG: TraM recognition domain-containing protein, partial [Gammaproteobacteria bacterium]